MENWQDFLTAFDEAKSLQESKTTLQDRTRKFKAYNTQLESLVDETSRYGFQTVIVTVGNAIHSDESLCNVIVSAGAEKVCSSYLVYFFFLTLFFYSLVQFFETRLKVNDREITGILKNHV